MTLEELADQYRPSLVDESVGVRRSWEEMFTYTFKHYSKGTDLHAVDLNVLSERLSSAGMHQAMVAGYLKRWRELLGQMGAL